MQKEIVEDLRQQQILLTAINSKLKEKNNAISATYQINANTEKISNQILYPQKPQIKKNSILFLVMILSVSALIFFLIDDTNIFVEERDSLKTKYVIENLQGDTIDTWKFWNIIQGSTLTVNILNSELLDNERILIIKDAITSYKTKQYKLMTH